MLVFLRQKQISNKLYNEKENKIIEFNSKTDYNNLIYRYNNAC